MADDTFDIIEPFDFHPCNSPRGMLYYDLKDLEPDQKRELNEFKINLVRENEVYLASHPEIRALIAMITRHVLKYRPRTELLPFIGQYFTKSPNDLEKEMNKYIRKREPHRYEGDSAVDLNQQYIKEELTILSEEMLEEEEEDLTNIPRQMLDEIVEVALARLGTKVQPTGVWKSDEAEPDEKMSIVRGIISEILQKTVKEDRREMLQYLYETVPKVDGGDNEEGADSNEMLLLLTEENPSDAVENGELTEASADENAPTATEVTEGPTEEIAPAPEEDVPATTD